MHTHIRWYGLGITSMWSARQLEWFLPVSFNLEIIVCEEVLLYFKYYFDTTTQKINNPNLKSSTISMTFDYYSNSNDTQLPLPPTLCASCYLLPHLSLFFFNPDFYVLYPLPALPSILPSSWYFCLPGTFLSYVFSVSCSPILCLFDTPKFCTWQSLPYAVQ